jgi:hypothetical protein
MPTAATAAQDTAGRTGRMDLVGLEAPTGLVGPAVEAAAMAMGLAAGAVVRADWRIQIGVAHSRPEVSGSGSGERAGGGTGL